jgi:ferrous iron transport protein A
MTNLTSASIGHKVVVRDLAKDSTFRKRLLDMGITPGVTMQIIGKAPFGDPIEVAVRGYRLVLRKNEATAVLL